MDTITNMDVGCGSISSAGKHMDQNRKFIRLCVFCINKNIPPPHNHTIRDFSKKHKPIICPELLQCKCSYCKCEGHTKKYCSVLKQKNAKISSTIPNVNKRGYENINNELYEHIKIPKIIESNIESEITDMDINGY